MIGHDGKSRFLTAGVAALQAILVSLGRRPVPMGTPTFH
jgi:hypothetical protein